MYRRAIILFICIWLSACEYKPANDLSYIGDDEVLVNLLKDGKLDYFFDNVNFYKFDPKTGLPTMELKADRAFNYSGTNIINLENIEFYFRDSKFGKLVADSGKFNEKNNVFKLNSNIRVVVDENTPNYLKVVTDKLTIDLANSIVWGDSFVKINTLHGNLQAQQFEFNLDDNILQMNKNVKGYYTGKIYD